MSQNVVNYGIDPSGAQLLDELLSGEQQNRLTMDGGNSRPPYAEIGTIWTDKSVTGKATLKRFNGTSDDVLMTVDETTGAITIPGFADTDLSNLSASGSSKFQEPLESGTNIKTVNGNSILGSGDITISAGANVDLSNLSAAGENHFANPDLSNLTATGAVRFQAPLVSGTNIKTLNNESLLGSGDISTGASIIVAWASGQAFYVKFSNGFIIQGGTLGAAQDSVVSFWVPFTSMYNAQVTGFDGSSAHTGYIFVVNNRTLTSMHVQSAAGGGTAAYMPKTWLAYGW